MKSSSLFVLTCVAFTACGVPATVATGPTTGPMPSTTGPVVRVPAVTLPEAPRNWQLLDEESDHVPGISSERAMRELLAGKTTRRTVLVAIIDNGIDTAQVDLRANLWTNPREIAANGKDDDNNGYIDDVHGWNFIGSRDGQDVHWDTFEITREYARCHNQAAAGGQPPITDAARCTAIDSDFVKLRKSIDDEVRAHRQIHDVYRQIIPLLMTAARTDSLTVERVRAMYPLTPELTQARQVFLDLAKQGATPSVIDEGLASLEGQQKYGLNPEYNTRTIVGDNYADVHERGYGNPDVMGQNADHGTHVAGIIGAVRGNGIGIDGIAPAVKLMMIRTVPEGDERDKDIANAIRYAVDNGAQIINMSFGKAYSPNKAVVDDAVKYADSHGVLMVHAAGNEGEDLNAHQQFPLPVYLGGGRPQNWIEVGASSWKGGDHLAARFSNYSRDLVDVFAPGVDILSTVPGNRYERNSGTSMATPVVSGVAALIMDYFPNLTAADVKNIIVTSATKVDQMVVRPGSKDTVSFASLSASGGIVNAYNAIKMAEAVSNGKTRP